MSWISSLFGGNQKRDTSYGGPKPYGSLAEAQGGPEYYKNITSRLAGEGVGYGDEYANQASSPVIARMRNQFNSYDIPALTSELSATGRRRGSAGFDQMARAYNQQGLDEGNVYSGLYQQQEQAKREDKNTALQDLGAFNLNDYNARGNLANFEYKNNRDQVGDASNQRAEGNAAFQRLIGVGTSLLPTGIGGTSSLTPQTSVSYIPQISQQSYYPGVSSISKKFGQQGGVSPYSTRLKY